MQVTRVELALDETTGMQMAAVGCLLMVAQLIADERPDHADVLWKVSRALIAQRPEQRLHDIVHFCCGPGARCDRGREVGGQQGALTMAISIERQIACVEREIALRRRAYPRWGMAGG